MPGLSSEVLILNHESGKRSCFNEVDGQKTVCVAQGGECRYNHNYYTSGMGDAKSWTTPIIDNTCPDQCTYKMLVCDNHGEKCEGSIEYYPQYNKFRGLFRKYCRNFDKFIKGDKDGKNEKGKRKHKMRIPSGNPRVYWR